MRLVPIVVVLLAAACSARAPETIEFGGGTMGTAFTVKLPGPADGVDANALETDVKALLADISRMMSTYISDSEISKFNASASTDWQPVSSRFCESVAHALELSEFTDGAFDITAGPLVNLWGFGPDVTSSGPPTQEEIDAALLMVGYRHLHADCSQPALRREVAGLVLDMSAYGKGYAVDRVAELLEARGMVSYLVEIGGELRVSGQKPTGEDWAIGIEIPRAGKREPYTVVHLTDAAVATSGDYRNFFEFEGTRYSHEIDTRTGRPVTHDLAAVSIVDKSGARADALATGLLVMGPDAGLALATKENIAALFLKRTGTGIDETVSPRFAALRRTL